MLLERCIIALLCLISTSAYANKMDFYVTSGAAFASLTNDSFVTLTNPVTNQYIANEKSITTPIASIGLGHTFQHIYNQPWSIAIGLTGFYFNFQDVSGIEYPFSSGGNFDTLNYQFNVKSYAALLESKFIYSQHKWRPYALLGLGSSWNNLFSYDEVQTNTGSSAVPFDPGFGDKTTCQFAYEVGIGIQYDIFKKAKRKNSVTWSVALDYRYLNLGSGELSPIPAQVSGDALTINAISSQAIMVTLQGSI